MVQPSGTPHQLGCQMGADEAVEPRVLFRRQRNQAEARHDRAFRQLQPTAERPRLGGMKRPGEQRRTQLLERGSRRKRRRHQPLALHQKRIEPLNKVVRIDDPEKLEIVRGKHDAIIRGSLADMPAAGRQREAQPFPPPPRAFEIANPDDDVVDAGYAVIHVRPSGFGGEP